MSQRIHYDYYKTSLTFSDLRKLKSSAIYRIVPSSIKNQVYLDLFCASFHCRSRNYHINQMIFFLATDSCVAFYF